MSDVQKLVDRLIEAQDAYYNKLPLMSDASYDLLEDELRKLDPNNAFFQRVGAAPGGTKVKHSTPMGSLNKAQTVQELRDWYASLGGKPVLFKSEKADGASLSIRYIDRKYAQALSRGDGVTGEDVTKNIALAKGVVKILPPTMPDGTATPNTVFVRAEVIVTLPDFKAHFPGESNPRNTAAGTMKRQSDNSKCQYLTVRAYQYLPDGVSTLPTKAAEFEALKGAGFQTPGFQVCNTIAEVERVYQDYIGTRRANLDYQVDGLVLDVNDTVTRENFGDLNSRPKGSIALKFPHEELPTTLRAIRWQVGKSGRLTPVAEFDTVNLVGSQIKQASLYNISYIEDTAKTAGQTGFGEGDKVLISKAGDVIPRLEALLVSSGSPRFVTPTVCPECGTPLERDGEYLVCRGEDCPAQIAGTFRRWVQKIGVLHCGSSIIEAWIDAGLITDLADLYLIDPDAAEDVDCGGRRAGGTATKAIKNLQAKKSLPLHVFVGALGIPLIGRGMAKIIVDGGIDSLSKMAKVKAYSEVSSIPGVGDTKAKAFVDGYTERLGLISKLLGDAGITIQTSTGPLKGKSMCQTEFRDAAMVDAFEKAGGTVKSGVSKDLTYLVCKDKTGTTGKLQKARSYGVTLLNESEMWDILKGV